VLIIFLSVKRVELGTFVVISLLKLIL